MPGGRWLRGAAVARRLSAGPLGFNQWLLVLGGLLPTPGLTSAYLRLLPVGSSLLYLPSARWSRTCGRRTSAASAPGWSAWPGPRSVVAPSPRLHGLTTQPLLDRYERAQLSCRPRE
ncbi:hypothetical protein [Pseudomonas delhiensis]|uniref:hypothetical protein n=1 Tax=Pseudomonas delhiensis TaxID=366289 RepID=UPI001113CC6B|nr:hypothetical protein [Pseudomonas delhiensis]